MQGPPDPNATNVVPPFSIEVCVGPEAEFRRAYPEPGSTETINANGVVVTIERDTYEDLNTYRYVYQHPLDETIHVVLIDVITGFSQRAQKDPEVLALIPQIAANLQFVDPS